MISIRKAIQKDCDLIVSYIKKLADYEKAPEEMILTVDELKRDGFSDHPLFESVIIEYNSETVGFALFYNKYSTWKGKTLFLEDLYIDELHRNKGIGLQVMKYLAEYAKKNLCKRLEWQVLDWNKPSIRFYEKIGAKLDAEWINCKLKDDQFNEFLEKF